MGDHLSYFCSHPLQEKCVPSFIENDTLLLGGPEDRSIDSGGNSGNSSLETTDQDIPSMLLLTGPNYSGKSVYLKQVGSWYSVLRAKTNFYR